MKTYQLKIFLSSGPMNVTVDEYNYGLFINFVEGITNGVFWITFRNTSGNKVRILSSKLDGFEEFEKIQKEQRHELVSITALAKLFNVHTRTVTRLCEKTLVDYGKIKKANLDTLDDLYDKLKKNGHQLQDIRKYRDRFEKL